MSISLDDTALAIDMPNVNPMLGDKYSQNQRTALHVPSTADAPPGMPQFDSIVTAAFSLLEANFDDQMNATSPGPIDSIGFQHIVGLLST